MGRGDPSQNHGKIAASIEIQLLCVPQNFQVWIGFDLTPQVLCNLQDAYLQRVRDPTDGHLFLPMIADRRPDFLQALAIGGEVNRRADRRRASKP